MADRPCALCTRPVGDAKVCVGCRDLLARDLGDVDYLDEQLTIVLTRQTCYAERNGPRSSETPLPVDLRASEAAWVLRNTLTTWCRVFGYVPPAGEIGPMCRGHRWYREQPERTLCRHDSCAAIRGEITNPDLSTWLYVRVEDIRHHEAADECMTEIGAAVTLVRRVIDAPANRTSFLVGPCPETPCPGEIRAYIPADERPARMQCTVDAEHVYEPYQWMRAGQRILRRKRENAA